MWNVAVTPAGSAPQLPVMVPGAVRMLDVPIIVNEPFRPDWTLPDAGANAMPPLLPLKDRLQVIPISAALLFSICTCVIKKKSPTGSTRVFPARNPSLGPRAPVSPCGPAGPVGPTAPTAPAGPCGPGGPSSPFTRSPFRTMADADDSSVSNFEEKDVAA